MPDETMNELQRAIGRLEAKVDLILEGHEEVGKLRERVEKLERHRSYLAGAMAAITLLWTFGKDLLGFVLR